MSLIAAVWQGRCPHCRQGKIFTFPLSNISKFGKMNTACPHCSVNFEPEPGFYFGAMFVSYAINVAIFIAVWIAMYVLWNPEDWIYVLGISIAAILATPFTFRFSRVLWLYWFGGIRYEPRQ